MADHEHYREICAAASTGQATARELSALGKHLAGCETCRQAYFDYLNLAARHYAEGSKNPVLSSEGARESLSSEFFAKRFFERAEQEGIRFSSDVTREISQLSPVPRVRPKHVGWPALARMVSAVALLCLAVSAGFFYGRRSRGGGPDLQAVRQKSTGTAVAIVDLSKRTAELEAANSRLAVEITRMKAELGKAGQRLQRTEASLDSATRNRSKLASSRAALEMQLKAAQQELAHSRTVAAATQQEAAKQRNNVSSLATAITDSELRIAGLRNELAEQSAVISKQKKLLALTHDVTDLMGARNLHIVDVVDTNSHGKARRAVGRIFYTEDKSLIFYAYDLNELKTKKGKYQYTVWARQKGDGSEVRSLGIFYSDNKTKRRWVFKCDDPKVLQSIGSVFVTLEPADSHATHPHGRELMYAYLGGRPNHP